MDKFHVMKVIKNVGFALQWLWLPLLSYAFGLKIYALMISKGLDDFGWPQGLDDFGWPQWRICLAIALINLVVMGKHLSNSRRDLSVFAALGTALPWGCLAIVWIIKLYSDWAFGWPPIEWIYITFLSTYTFPLLVAVPAVISYLTGN